MARNRVHSRANTPPPNQLALLQTHTYTPPPIASSSQPTIANSQPSTSEEILHRLLEGEGVTTFEKNDLIEQCDSCAMHFLNTHLRKHIKECPGVQNDMIGGFSSDSD